MKLTIVVRFKIGGFWPIRRSFSMRMDDAPLAETASGFLLALIAKGGWQATENGAVWESGQFSVAIEVSNA